MSKSTTLIYTPARSQANRTKPFTAIEHKNRLSSGDLVPRLGEPTITNPDFADRTKMKRVLSYKTQDPSRPKQ